MARPPADQEVLPVDPRSVRVHRRPAVRDVPYVPTDDAVVPAILRLAKIGASDVIYDLGCGDGRIVIAAARHFGARGVGIDIDPDRILECRENAKRAGVTDRVEFLQTSFFGVDLSAARASRFKNLNASSRHKRRDSATTSIALFHLPPRTRCNAGQWGHFPNWEVDHP